MASVNDVAAAILVKTGAISTMKLQKLVYYSQAWSLVWDERPLFDDEIEAWANGPVTPALYRLHRGRFTVSEWPAGDPTHLSADERETVDVVVSSYGSYSGQQLSELSHAEGPWREARVGLSPTVRSNNTISKESMQEFYGSLAAEEGVEPV